MRSLLTIAVTLGSVGLLAACSKVEGTPAEPIARPVRVAAVEAPEQQTNIRYSVSIQPYDQVALSFKAGGYVAGVAQRRDIGGRQRALQPGDVVNAGMVVASVRDDDYRERVKQAESSVREVEVSLTKSRLDLERAQTLFTAESLTKPELDAARAAVDSAEARLASGRAQLELAKISLADCALVTPIGGVVLERRIEAGTLVGSGTVGFVIGRVSDVKAVFGVPDSLVQRMVPGQPVVITTEAYQGSTFTGRLTGIAPTADQQSRVFNIEVTIPNGDGRLKPGMIGTIEIPAQAAASSLAAGAAVPLEAIVRSTKSPDGYGVFVVESNDGRLVARARTVTLGAAEGNAVAVTQGVARGERVIVMGANLVTDGERVRVIP